MVNRPDVQNCMANHGVQNIRKYVIKWNNKLTKYNMSLALNFVVMFYYSLFVLYMFKVFAHGGPLQNTWNKYCNMKKWSSPSSSSFAPLCFCLCLKIVVNVCMKKSLFVVCECVFFCLVKIFTFSSNWNIGKSKHQMMDESVGDAEWWRSQTSEHGLYVFGHLGGWDVFSNCDGRSVRLCRNPSLQLCREPQKPCRQTSSRTRHLETVPRLETAI